MTFNPNDNYKAPLQPGWATYIKTRSPKFKVHTTIGHAKNALNVKYPYSAGTIYAWTNG